MPRITFHPDDSKFTQTEREYAVSKFTRLARYAEIESIEFSMDLNGHHCTLTTSEGESFVVDDTPRKDDCGYQHIDRPFKKLRRQLSDRRSKKPSKAIEDPMHDFSDYGEDFDSDAEHGSDAESTLRRRVKVSPPLISIVWDPSSISERDYAEIASAVAEVVRERGGVGIELIRTGGIGIPQEAEVPV